MFKQIEANITSALSLSDDQLALVAAITGKSISTGDAPLIGRYLNVDCNRHSEFDPSHPDLQFSYEWTEKGELVRIYIGSEIHGPMLSWCSDGWRNLYGKGNHGKNGACGGSWSSESRRTYPDITATLAARDYMVVGIKVHRSELIEGPAILRALGEIAKMEKRS
jgi:hypothetical protein